MRSRSVAFNNPITGESKIFQSYRQTVRYFKENFKINKTAIDDVLYRNREKSKQHPDLVNNTTLQFLDNTKGVNIVRKGEDD